MYYSNFNEPLFLKDLDKIGLLAELSHIYIYIYIYIYIFFKAVVIIMSDIFQSY